MSNSKLTSNIRDTVVAHDALNDDRETGEPVLELDGVEKRYGGQSIIEGLSLTVRDGELLTLLGPSGCGKTTTLRLIAGLERPNGGAIRLNDTPIAGGDVFREPERRGIGVVFQEFALFPHMTAEENIAFGLDDRPKVERERRVEELLDLVGLSEHRDSSPNQLSGGQQQRVALARSLAPEPEILLLDEPFSNLDVDLRVQMREEVRSILKEAGVTAISVTHDQEEAMSISDRVAVMNDGRIEQVGRPDQVFQQPRSRFVASFLGQASFLSGYVNDDRVETHIGAIDRDQIHGLSEEYDKTRVDVLVRPDDIEARPAPETDGANGRVVYRRYLGPTVLYRVKLGDPTAADAAVSTDHTEVDTVECMHNHTETVELDTAVEVTLEADHELAWFPREQRTE